MTVKTPNAAKPDPRRRLPAVGALCEDPIARPLKARYGAAALTRAVRAVLSEARTRLAADPDAAPTTGALLEAVEARLADGVRETLFPVINATGVVIHTNLGRAPLAPEAVAAAALAAGYANLELDLVTGRRSSRQEHLDPLIAEMTGAEAGLAVNNCAGAVLLALAAVAEGAPVIVSRGELVEIGGGFRVPDVVAQSGSRLIEVGTTNRTHLRDYEKALADHPDARVILRTHPSNFRISGFTSAPSLESLAHFAHAHGLLLVEDLGGGALVDLAPFGLADEPTVQDSIAAGVDLVLFSGDKLLGGPQAGLAAGRRALVERLEAHPLARALRLDKLSTAALAATLRLYRPPCDPFEQIPILRLLAQDTTTLDARAIALKSQVGGFENLEIEIMETEGYAGGGALPMLPLPGRALALRSLRLSAGALAHQLRTSATPILGRIEQDRVLLEMRTLADEDIPILASAIAAISQIPLGPEA
ncbi:L-seryl-tRNA(Sec) selenium transferase [Phenylobacterium sp.]|uniref:L-seryl-tRNA(Sec) selenium transferase n=1 Tax=Phenylobacterium sp. TaxID=1871053 RepID=UPI0025DB3C41|nr:L-seryl-tRNA(Sec) selenium transferase [Phenylobacterium sp.]MCA3741475.1 L-seryl-tRNA(Sec) selenium transferase [Phenylobacterium sp.]